MIIKNKISKKLLAIILTVVLMTSILPVGFASAFAAMKDNFKVEIENYSFSAEVTLTDSTDSKVSQTVTATNGVATFTDFVDDEKNYNLEISDMVGYEDYTASGLIIESNSITVKEAELTAIEKALASGVVVDENGTPVSGVKVTYSAYADAINDTVTTNLTGSYSFEFYKNIDYSITIEGDEKYVIKNDTFKSATDKDFGTHQLEIKQFGITITTGANGSSSQSNVIVNYGEDAPSIIITADTNYRIDTLTIDGKEIEDTKGLSTYDVSSQLKNITDDHTVSVSFFRPEYEITINYNSNGEVKDNSDNPVAAGGKIILKEGDSAGYKAVASENYHISSVVTDDIPATGTFDNSKTEHQDTFDDNKSHTVTITFSINTYKVTVNADENGTASASVETVDHGNDTVILITPNSNYDVELFSISNDTSVDASSLIETDNNYQYTISNVTEDITVDVTFKQIEEIVVSDILNNDFYSITFSKEPVVIGNKYVVGKNESVTIAPSDSYLRVRINGSWLSSDRGNSVTYTNSKVINKIEVSTKIPGGWDNSYSPNIQFVVDSTAPTISQIAKSPKKDYNNNSYSITAKVEDDHAGVDKVYYNTTDDFDSASVANYDSSTKIATFTTTEDEYNSKYYIWAVDKVGNRTSSKNVDIKIDNTNPTVDKFEFSSSTLNVCDFGTFSAENIKVTIAASDKSSTTTNSGVKEITFNGETKAVSSNGTATFTLESSDFASPKAVTATVTDNAGNTCEAVAPSSTNSNVKSNLITISTSKANIDISRNEEAKYVDGDKYWYADDTDFTVKVSDTYGIKSVLIKMNGKVVVNETLDTTTTAVTKKDYTINTSENALDGENKITVDVVNVNNNSSDTENLSVYKDTKNPNVVNFELNATGTSIISKVLNFLTFGNFFNEKIEIIVKGQDDESTSGINSITLYADEVAVDTQDCVDGVAKFEVPAEVITDETLHLNKTISAKVTDNVGNVTSNFVYPTTTNSDTFASSDLMIETIKPTAVITCADPAQNKNEETADVNDWYADDTDFNIAINDADSGIRSVSVKVNGTDIFTDSDSVAINENFNERTTITNDLTFRVNTNLAERAEYGSYKIEVVVTDNAGNVSETVTKTIYKDIDAPSVTNFKFEAKGYDKDNTTNSTDSAPVAETSYGYYFMENTTVTVTANDITPTSGVKSITYYTVDKDGGRTEEKTELVNAENNISFVIPANFKGQIYAKATDNVDNTTTDFVNPNGTIIEDEEQHEKTSYVKYTLKDNAVKDENGNNLYGDDTTVDIEIADTYSGIRQIDWEIVAPYDDKRQAGTVTVDNNGKVTSVLNNTIAITNNSNDIEIHMTLTDRAGNVTKDIVQKLSVDKSAPFVAVQMNENDDDNFSGFFRGKREATVYVYERNFDSSDFTFDVKRTDDNGNISDVSPNAKFEKVGTQVINGVECYVYKMKTTFSEDGDYEFSVNAQDTAAHIRGAVADAHKVNDTAVKYSSDKTVDYVEQNDAYRNIDNAFTIDNTKPVVSVSYDNNDVRNDKYFNNHRTATITVTEHNFVTTNNRITYTRTSTRDGSNIEEPQVSSWSRNGNTYTATINYNVDGDYTFGIDVVDKAGNKTNDSEVTYSGSATKDFVVDTTIDKPVITGVENGNSYKESVLPKINFSDINFKDVEITLLRTRKDEIDVNVTKDFINISSNEKGGSFSANEDTFKKLQENDGIYTLSIEISDKAENTSSEQVVFTVNRFGSVYSLGDYLSNTLNDKYVQSIDNDIVITEYNPDRLVKGKLDVVVTRDGSPVDYEEGELKISPVVNEFAKIGSSGWYQYEYTIRKSVFTDDNGTPIDGIYKVYVGSEDTVGNKSENISYDESEVIFRLDHTAPTIKSVSGLEKKIVNADKQKVTYEIFDAIGIAEIDVYYYGTNGEQVDHIRATEGDGVTDILNDVTSYSGEFTIGNSTSAKAVRIVVKDLAGNVTDTDNKDFDIDSIDFNREITVSTNFFVRWYANKPLFWGSIAVIVVLFGGLAFLIATKRRKSDDAKTEEIKRNARSSQR